MGGVRKGRREALSHPIFTLPCITNDKYAYNLYQIFLWYWKYKTAFEWWYKIKNYDKEPLMTWTKQYGVWPAVCASATTIVY